ncbi:GNAT family N-acetyltransferase [Spirosoma montaniterrae]|uniref:N-acetyltransferase domain-containing protein n=1 Tax=Spirosoma montaniterrae TaxID=1178516 RepID=A0A1P9WTW1_9BACT|nr:GNAT family N-acetyltransferase [Spirosoma montaniterrae]AQG78821.1 hypothetical protein AWR27_05485 [Spirosoma montaniterrae]
MSQTCILQTDRLTIRQLTTDDTAFIIELVNSPGWLQFIGDRHIHTPEQARYYLENGPIVSYAQRGYGLYGVGIKPGSTLIGMCGLIKRDTLPQPDIGFAFLPDYIGKGFAFEAARAVRTYAHEQLGLSVLYAIVLPQNKSSIRLLERIGLAYIEPFQQGDTELLLYGSEQKN